MEAQLPLMAALDKNPMLAGECGSRTARIDQAATVTSCAEAQT
jgi:hypothetical protein